MRKTLLYYEQNAENFIRETREVDFSEVQELFLSKLEKGALILDFGCGSGRDTKCFLNRGYFVEAAPDRRSARLYRGKIVILMTELEEYEKYDGIWACASILHLTHNELKEVLKKILLALKKEGIAYLSFKYGAFEGERRGRYFLDMTEEAFAELLNEAGGFDIEEEWITGDGRPERGDERWLNLILRKRNEG